MKYNQILVLLKGNRWSYDSTFLFIGSVATTIGYGNVVPKTDNGRILCCVFRKISKFYKKLRVSPTVFKKVRKRCIGFSSLSAHLNLLMAQWVDMEAKKTRTERMSVRDHPT